MAFGTRSCPQWRLSRHRRGYVSRWSRIAEVWIEDRLRPPDGFSHPERMSVDWAVAELKRVDSSEVKE